MKKYDIPMMKTAQIWAEMSYCKRAKVGAVLSQDNRIISIGYNGTPANSIKKISKTCALCKGQGFDGNKPCYKCGGQGKIVEIIPDNDCEEYDLICDDCDGNLSEYDDIYFQCDTCGHLYEKESRLRTNHNKVIHAEANAILFCAKNGISTNNATLYVTLNPCPECAKMILQAGIKRVVYLEKYRKDDGLQLLQENGVEIEQIKLGGSQ